MRITCSRFSLEQHTWGLKGGRKAIRAPSEYPPLGRVNHSLTFILCIRLPDHLNNNLFKRNLRRYMNEVRITLVQIFKKQYKIM